MNSKRVRLCIESLEDRITPSAVDIGFGTGNYQSVVAGYKFFQDNATFQTTSSAFGYSSASMTKSQQVTTKNGGLVDSRLKNAFDGALSFGLNKNNPAPYTYRDSDGVVDITGNVLTGSLETHEAASSGGTFDGLELAQQNGIFALDPTTPVIRSILTITNPTNAPITDSFGDFNNLGSNSLTTIYATSSGDSSLTPGTDRWVLTYQGFNGGVTSSEPRILEVMQGPGSVATPYSTSWSGNGSDITNWFYNNVTINPGETKYIMEFVELSGNMPKETSDGHAVFDSNSTVASSGLLAGLTTQQLQNTVNWNISGPSVTPASPADSINSPTVTIHGSGFDAATPGNNTVTFDDGASGVVTAATSTSLTVDLTTQPSAPGNLDAIVTTDGVISGSAVQVATIIPHSQYVQPAYNDAYVAYANAYYAWVDGNGSYNTMNYAYSAFYFAYYAYYFDSIGDIANTAACAYSAYYYGYISAYLASYDYAQTGDPYTYNAFSYGSQGSTDSYLASQGF